MRSTKSRICASITAGLALSAVGLLAATGGTVAQVTDTISAKVDLAVEGNPVGIARTVSLGFDYTRSNNVQTVRERSATVNSLTDARNDAPIEDQTPYTYPSGIRVNKLINDRGCASSSFDSNTDRCFKSESGSLVSASTGQAPENGDFEIDFRDNNLNDTLFTVDFSIHDIQTSVSCFPNGDVSAGQPSAAYWAGGQGTSSRNTNWRGFPDDNQYERIRQWMRNLAGQNQAMTIEVQSIRQTFQNPPRALSAIVMYVTSSNARNGGGVVGDFAFVSKSECAVSPDGTVTLDPSTTFGPLVPAVRRLETPGWGGNYTTVLSTGAVPSDSLMTTSEISSRDAHSRLGPADDIEVIESGDLLVDDPRATTNTSVSSEDEATTPSSSAPSASAPATVSTPASTSPTPKVTQTTTSGGPTPSTSASTSEPTTAGYTTATGQSYASATGATLTRSQRELVEEAIAAAQSAESGDLTDGASYATISSQLDSATLIVKTADGGTLRIVWEK